MTDKELAAFIFEAFAEVGYVGDMAPCYNQPALTDVTIDCSDVDLVKMAKRILDFVRANP